MEHWIYDNGNLSKYDTTNNGLFIYQRMRATAGEVFNIPEHIELLKSLAAQLFPQVTLPSAEEIEQACSQLLRHGGYAYKAIHFIELRLYDNGQFNLRVIETSLYKSYTLRVMRPKVVLFDEYGDHIQLPTSAKLATFELLNLKAYMSGGKIAVCADSSGTISSIDGASPIIVRGREIIIHRTTPSVYTDLLIKYLEQLEGYTVIYRPINASELNTADELIYADHRGITAAGEIDTHIFADSIAYTVAKRIVEAKL